MWTNGGALVRVSGETAPIGYTHAHGKIHHEELTPEMTETVSPKLCGWQDGEPAEPVL